MKFSNDLIYVGLTDILNFFEIVVVRPKVGEIFAALVKTGRDAIEIVARYKTGGLTLSLYASVPRLPFRP